MEISLCRVAPWLRAWKVRTLLFNGVYKNRSKKGNRLSRCSLSCASFQKMRFSKFVNLVNALAIHSQQIVVRAFQIPPAAHRALCYSMVYTYIELVKKTEIGYLDCHSVAHRFKQMRFSKIENLANALAIHNHKIVVRTFQIPPASSVF